MKIQTNLMAKAYISAMKDRMGSRFSFSAERFTGIFIGNLFYVTHHAGYEWNRRITNQKNAAIGFIKQRPTGNEVCFVRFQGMLCPNILLPYLVFVALYYILTYPVLIIQPFVLILTLLILIGTPLIYTLFESMTDGSIEGRKCLMGLLIDPSDYFAYLHHQNEIKE